MADQSQSPQSESSSTKGWRGQRQEKREVVRHRWQKDATLEPQRRTHAHEQFHRLRIGLLLTAGGILLALFVYAILFATERTPFVVVAARDYELPFSPNAWATEDIDALRDDEFGLDGRTITVSDLSSVWSSRERGLRGLTRQLKEIANNKPRQGAVVVYISMHGCIDAAGRACLIPPGSLPLLSDTWLPVVDFLKAVQELQLPDHLHKLIVFDCARERVNWRYGLLYNGFVDGLPAALEEVSIPNLAIISSTSAGEKSWTSGDLQCSAFGHFFRLGLAGEADLPAEGGDGNRYVSARELHHYLERNVDVWVQHNRGEHQHPALIPSAAPDFDIVRVVSDGTRRKLVDHVAALSPAAPNVADEEILQLWQAIGEIESLDPLRWDPLTWRDLQHKLVQLERLSAAGSGYAEHSKKLLSELKSAISGIRERAQSLGSSPSDRAKWNLLTSDKQQLPPQLDVHSLSLAQKFGEINRSRENEIRSLLNRFQESPSQQELADVLQAVDEQSQAFASVHLLRIFDRFGSKSTWRQPADLSQAISMRMQADTVCAPNDERVQYWIRGAAHIADEQRRLAEDRLFTSNQQGADTWAETEQLYNTAQGWSDQVTHALKIRDLVYSELPYLAEWIGSPAYQRIDAKTEESATVSKLLQLIRDNQELAAAIADFADAANGQVALAPDFGDRAASVERDYESLRAQLDQQYASLLDAELMTAELHCQIESLLQVPLLPRESESASLTAAEQRIRLIGKSRQVGAELHRKQDDDEKNGNNQDETDNGEERHNQSEYVELAAIHWDQHPAIALLSQQADESNQEQTGSPIAGGWGSLIAKIGDRSQEVRRRLAGLSSEIRDLQSLSSSSPAQVRGARSQADRLMRAAASLTSVWPESDPVISLRLYDLQQLLLWHCSRTLDDFLGRGRGDQLPFFEMAAIDYLDSAESILDPNESVRRQMTELEELLQVRQQIASNGITPTADNILLINETDDINVRVAIKPTSTGQAKDFPTGEAAVLVRDLAGEISPMHQAVVVPLETGTNEAEPHHLQFTLPGSELFGRGPELQAVVFFRGHEFSAPFLLNAVGGVQYSFSPEVQDSATVTLRGRLRKSASIVFIMDCSNSMSEMVTVEVPETDGGTQELSRLDVAKSALLGMLDRFAEQGDARIGVRFYGHRVGWNTKQANQLLRQENYGREIPADLQPWQDVELILPVGRFDATSVGQVQEVLETVKPWGETPLYRAIVQAQADLAGEPESIEKSIVVITDGANYQFNAAEPTTRVNVESGAQRVQAPIHIVGFGIPENQQQATSQEFDALTTATGGSYTRAEEATTLVSTLEELLGPSQYQVVTSSSEPLGTDALGTPIRVPLGDERPMSFVIAVDGLEQPVEIFGGESLEFLIAQEGRVIEGTSYLNGAPRFAPLFTGTGGPATGLIAGIHRPVAENTGVRFPVSIQRRDRGFIARPEEIWIEITPIQQGGGRGQTRNYYDANYQSETPVPVVSWFAEGWPSDAELAEVRVWCKPRMTAPQHVVRLSDVADLPPNESLDIPGVSGISFQVRTKGGTVSSDPFVVGVVERHAEDSPGIAAIKVDLQASQRPLTITRQFDDENRLVRHTFTFAPEHTDAVRREAVLQFTTREAMQADAWQLVEPVVTEVSGATDILRLTAPQIGP